MLYTWEKEMTYDYVLLLVLESLHTQGTQSSKV